MTTLLVKPWVIENDQLAILAYLKMLGNSVKSFDFLRWITNWLKDPAGSFWGRKVYVPKVGDVCLARVGSVIKDGESYVAHGRISDSQCTVTSAKLFGENVKVRVASIRDGRMMCETVDDGTELSSSVACEYKIYYSAAGVTGRLERMTWRYDVVGLTALTPNENLPIGVISGFDRIRIPSSIDTGFAVYAEAGKGNNSGYVLAVECDNCGGESTVTCSKCSGTGKYQPTCRVCGGEGYSTCRKCDGSGTWKYGGECFACGGTGRHECGVCHGEGHLDYSCKACGGTGEQECWVCHGSGVRHIRCDYGTGKLSISGKGGTTEQVDAKDVFLWREDTEERVELSGCWHQIEQLIIRSVDRREQVSRREVKLKEDVDEILKGLDEKILHVDTTKLPPVHAVLREASLERRKGKAVYHLKEKGVSAWKEHHNEPYPKGTPLQIDGVEPPEGKDILYEEYRLESRELVVAFPQEMDIEPLRGRDLEIRSAEMRPPELRQKDFLQRWKDNVQSPVYRAIVEGCAAVSASDGLRLFNTQIASYKRQREAVAAGISEAPLFLLKGPPGTGKTTIIVEIIRQAIHRGQRVLLTSQTHQAVENVLEKLHALMTEGTDDSIRMVHYTAQEGKASALARQYAEGVGTAEVAAIREHVSSILARSDERLQKWQGARESIRALCDEGAARATDMETLDEQWKIEQANIANAFHRAASAIANEVSRKHGELEGSLGKEIQELKNRLDEQEKKSIALGKDIDRLQTEIVQLQERKAYLAKGSFFVKVAGVFSDGFKAEKVEERLASAIRSSSERIGERLDLDRNSARLRDDIERRQAQLRSAHETVDREGDAKTNSQRSMTDLDRCRKQGVYDAQSRVYSEQQARCLENLKTVLGCATGLDSTAKPDQWRDVYRKFEQDCSELEKRVRFISGWEKVVAEKPEEVGRFLKAQMNVFLATCVGVGGWRSLMDGTYDGRFEEGDNRKDEEFFDLVIVDEAGHATVAETIIPLSMGRRTILIGDDKQLPPMDDDDLETYSLFSYLWEDKNCKVPRVMLDTQFRMHPDIADFVSATFYNGELKNGVTVADRAFQFSSFNRPVCLLSTSNQPNRYETFRNPSYENKLEAAYVKEIIDALIQHCNEHGGRDKPVSVAVITPYAEQVSLIRKLLKPVFGASGNVLISEDDVASVDKFQGGERDVVIASFVRSPQPGIRSRKLTFVHDLKRMNVAFSRPRKMLILVGDIVALSTRAGREEGCRAFAAFHKVAHEKGLEVLAWERRSV